jgi:hypothetical protein
MGTARRQVRIFNAIDICRPSARTWGGAEGFELHTLYVNNMLAQASPFGSHSVKPSTPMLRTPALDRRRVDRFAMAQTRPENNVAASPFSF